MTTTLPRLLIAAALATVALAAWLWSASGAPEATTGAPTPTPEATATPDPSRLRLRVVHDLDRNGAADPGEPGLPGWQLIGGCSDAIQIQTTDADGNAYLFVSDRGDADGGGVLACVRVTRPFGWFPVTPVSVSVPIDIDRASGVTFLVHDLGRTVMEASGEEIVGGLPGGISLLRETSPFTGAGAGCLETFEPFGPRVLIIVGADVRPGCPTEGAAFDILLNRQVARSLVFTPGQQLTTTFVIEGDSMRVGGSNLTSAQIDGTECGVVRQHGGGLIPPGSVTVYVLSDEVRPGCGVPGALVRFFREGRPLEPLVPWRAGTASYPEFPELNFAPEQVVVPPTTGNAGLK